MASSSGVPLASAYATAQAVKYEPCAVQSEPAAKPPIEAPNMAAVHIRLGTAYATR